MEQANAPLVDFLGFTVRTETCTRADPDLRLDRQRCTIREASAIVFAARFDLVPLWVFAGHARFFFDRRCLCKPVDAEVLLGAINDATARDHGRD